MGGFAASLPFQVPLASRYVKGGCDNRARISSSDGTDGTRDMSRGSSSPGCGGGKGVRRGLRIGERGVVAAGASVMAVSMSV